MNSEYRRGVEDALKPLEEIDGPGLKYTSIGAQRADGLINMIFNERKNKLLTKKVTKWVAVGISPSNGKPYAQGYFKDTKELAIANCTASDPARETIGVYSIEIEVPID